MEKKYRHKIIENKWSKRWLDKKLYYPKAMSSSKKKFYNLWMFPYPSAEGLHAGHAFASTGSDIFGRFMRMSGVDVFQPIGYDSFGIHSENFAIKIGEHPKKMLKRTTAYYEKQLKSLGHAYDWTRTVTTSDIDYYRWTQWIFTTMFKAGLAYRKKSEVNWCPSCKTVLADEQVMTPTKAGKIPPGYKSIEGVPEGVRVCERCGNIVSIKQLEQWMFRITEYADKLLANLEKIDWPESIKTAQMNWIGKKEGINIKYKVEGNNHKIICWTSRPDTNFGATFIVLAPEHSLALELAKSKYKQNVSKYIEKALKKNKEDRIAEGREKTGVFTGSYAINQLNGYKLPIWISDFVLTDVGAGAVVGVPGHDKRDFEFAKKYDLEIVRVVVGKDNDTSPITKIEQVQEYEGKMINSGFLNDEKIQNAIQKMMSYLEKKEWGERIDNYHLRDWIISRQRYWGPPIPMIYCDSCAKRDEGWLGNSNKELIHKDHSDWEWKGWYPEKRLPVELPFLEKYEPEGTGKGPLAKADGFVNIKCPHCGIQAKRETDVSDTFLDSSWYFLRYPSVDSTDEGTRPFNSDITKKWLPVDLYFGGAEHAVLHLMYSRFVTMVLFDKGFIGFDEPFPKFFAHGLMIKDGVKMSKSRGNVVNPDEYIEKFGSDTLRLYLMFMGPMDGYPDFRDTGIEGMRRFIERVWNLYTNHKDGVVLSQQDAKNIGIKLHNTIKKVTKDIKVFHYNTAIASMMELVNLLRDKSLESQKKQEKTNNIEWNEALEKLCLLLAPFTPHISEEIWNNILDRPFSVHVQKWPKYNKSLIIEEEVNVVIQVDGKLRANIKVSRTEAKIKEKVVSYAKENENVNKWLGKGIKQTVFVNGKLVNFVTEQR